MKRTPLYDYHRDARIVEFHSWQMPLDYGSVLDEHRHVRERAGMFDVSHMGQLFVRGSKAVDYLYKYTVNRVYSLDVGQGQYTLLCNASGGIIDDLILYRCGEEDYLLCVNAGNTQRVFQHLSQEGVPVRDESEDWALIAVQGPQSRSVLERVFGDLSLPYMHITALAFGEGRIWCSRSGYTGELGYELFVPRDLATRVWRDLAEYLRPIGLGARDTLRLEAGYLLHGQDMGEATSPMEVGLAWVLRGERDFFGAEGVGEGKRRLQAFKLLDPGVARTGMEVFVEGELVGRVTSASVLPTVGGSGGLVFCERKLGLGTRVEVSVRGKFKAAEIVRKPFYKARVK